jgi:hypothetical protein
MHPKLFCLWRYHFNLTRDRRGKDTVEWISAGDFSGLFRLFLLVILLFDYAAYVSFSAVTIESVTVSLIVSPLWITRSNFE